MSIDHRQQKLDKDGDTDSTVLISVPSFDEGKALYGKRLLSNWGPLYKQSYNRF